MQIGDTIGKYQLVRQLGRGGMGEVWLANASGYGGFAKTVVLKTLLPELSSDPLFIELLAQEARLSARLSHPNLIEVFDFSEHDGVYLLAMEYVSGLPLNHIMRGLKTRGWPLPAWFALRLAWECCRGLDCAHSQGVIHCDLSPSNVMVTFTGVTKVLDFGVAHSSARGTKGDRLKGKFPYMAPERIESLITDRRTDVYALGVLLYLMFTGRLPFVADNDADLFRQIVRGRPPRPSELCPIDSRIEDVILQAMQPDPRARYETIGDMLAALSACLEGQLGGYGQQDVATFVGRFAEDASDEDAEIGDSSDLHSFDVDVESSVLAIPNEPPPPPRSTRAATASTKLVALTRPAALLKPVSDVFSKVSPLEASPLDDARTTVQSLFGGRPAPYSRSSGDGHTRLFDVHGRPTARPNAHEDAPRGDVWPWPTSRTK